MIYSEDVFPLLGGQRQLSTSPSGGVTDLSQEDLFHLPDGTKVAVACLKTDSCSSNDRRIGMSKSLKKALLAVVVVVCLTGCASTPEAKSAKALQRGKDAMQRKDYTHAVMQFKVAAHFQPKAAEPLYQLGLAYLEIGDVDTAVQALVKASTVDPKHTDSQLKLAQLMALHQDPEVVREAERRARAVMAASQRNSDAISTLALAEMRLGETASAEQHLQEALAKFPKDVAPSVMMAMLKMKNNDSAGAEAILKRLVDQLPRSVEALLAMERFYMSARRLPDAEIYVERCLAVDGNNASALLDLAAIQMANGQKAQAEQTYVRVSKIPDARYRSMHALFIFQQGRRDEAINELKRLVGKDSNDRTIRTQLISAYIATNRISDAEQLLNNVLKKNRKDVDALLQRSQIYVLGNKLGQAQSDLNTVIQFRPDSGTAHYVLARVHQLQGALLNQRRELNEALRLDPNLLAARIDLAEALIAANAAKAAFDLMNAVPTNQRDDLSVIAQRNWALWAMGDVAEMRRSVDRGLGLNRTPDLVLQDALLKIQARDTVHGREALEQVLKMNPEDIRALETLVRTYVAEKQPQVALDKIKQIAAQNPKSPSLQQYLGMSLAANGKFTEARASFEAAKSANPGYVAADFGLAELDLTEGKLDSARSRLTGVLNTNQDNLDARLLLGMVEEVAGRYDLAVTHYRKVLELESRNLYALNNIAYRLADNNQTDEALKYAQQALEIGADNPAVQDTIGWAYYRKGLYKNALQYLTSAVAGGKVPVRMYHLVMVYAKLGDKKHARETFDVAYKMDPNLPEAKVAQAALSP